MADSLLDGDNQSPEDRDAIIAKWKDKPQEELLSAKAESDLYIRTLTARLDDLKKDYLQLRDQHQAGTDLKELIDQVKQSRQLPDQSQQHQRDDVQPATIKPEDIESMIKQHVSANELAKQQQMNFQSVQAKLRETYGPDYQSHYKQRLGELGLTPEFADELAKNHPSVFSKTFELDRQQSLTGNNLPRSSNRPSSFAPQTPVRDWNYYQELKKKDPKIYLDPKITLQMHNDAIELGDRFGMPVD